MRFQEAADKFAAALAIDPLDSPSKMYLERCKDLIADPPEEDWDGVFVMKHK